MEQVALPTREYKRREVDSHPSTGRTLWTYKGSSRLTQTVQTVPGLPPLRQTNLFSQVGFTNANCFHWFLCQEIYSSEHTFCQHRGATIGRPVVDVIIFSLYIVMRNWNVLHCARRIPNVNIKNGGEQPMLYRHSMYCSGSF